MDLDRYDDFSRLDYSGLLRNIDEFPDQVLTAAEELGNLILPSHYIQANNVILLGTGANYIANTFVETLASDSHVPIIPWKHDYLVRFVSNKSLVIASSYSGDTQETVACFEEAAKNGSKMLGITSGGRIASLSRKYRSPLYTINYGSSPRASLGFIVSALYGVMSKLGFIDGRPDDMREAAIITKGFQQKIKAEVVTTKNIAKVQAGRLKGRIPIIIGTKHLEPVALRLCQQLNQTSRSSAFYQDIVSLRYSGILGTDFPTKLSDKVIYLLFQSQYCSEREKELHEEIMRTFKRRGIGIEIISIESPGSPLAEGLQAFLLADYISYYLAILEDIDPDSVNNRN